MFANRHIDITNELMAATSSNEPVEQLGVPVDSQEFWLLARDHGVAPPGLGKHSYMTSTLLGGGEVPFEHTLPTKRKG